MKYLQIIRDIRENNPDLFEKIKQLPKKARTAKQKFSHANSLLTYFRRGKLQKFFISYINNKTEELDFMAAAQLLESKPEEKKENLSKQFYDLLDKNKEAFIFATTEEIINSQNEEVAIVPVIYCASSN